eukprot:919788-Amorphochlora_amoeboformis.AAC.1
MRNWRGPTPKAKRPITLAKVYTELPTYNGDRGKATLWWVETKKIQMLEKGQPGYPHGAQRVLSIQDDHRGWSVKQRMKEFCRVRDRDSVGILIGEVRSIAQRKDESI